MTATVTTCPSCRSDDRKAHPDLIATQRIAVEIVRGGDLGGIFELANELAKARCDVGIDGDPKGLAATRAAVRVREAFGSVRHAFEQLEEKEEYCTACRLRELLAFLIEVAVSTVKRQFPPDTLTACVHLAGYCGDDERDADATRVALERARDVFLAALAMPRSP